MALLAFALLLIASLLGYAANLSAARALRAGGARLHSLPGYHSAYAALWVLLPGMAFLLLFLTFQGPIARALVMNGLPPEALAGLDGGARALIEAEIVSLAQGNVFGTPAPWKVAAGAQLLGLLQLFAWVMIGGLAALLAACLFWARRHVVPAFRARQAVERMLLGLMWASAFVAIFTTLGIVLSLLFESARFFALVPIQEFLFGLNWEPQIAIRPDQVAGAGAFGWLPVILGTLVITTIALLIAVPIGLLTAIYLSEFAPPALRAAAKPMLEILAGVPTVVYGFFAVLTVAPALRRLAEDWGLTLAPNTALVAGGVMAIMLIPFISSFADDALSAVPRALRDGSLALGATRGETMMKVLFPAALPGIMGGVLLAVSRAIGETMIVVMAAGLIARLTINPLESVTTVTVQIVTLLIGDTSFDNPKTLAAFALGLMLFLATLIINVIALRIVRKYREVYE